MRQKKEQCLKHGNRFICICTENDFEEDRRLCLQCLNGQTCYELNEFVENVKSKLHSMEKTQALKANFKVIEVEINKMLINLEDQLDKINCLIDQDDSLIYQIKQDLFIHHKNILNFNQETLNIMVSILNGSYIDDVKLKQLEFRKTVEKNIQEIEALLKNSCDKVSQISSKVLIENQQNQTKIKGRAFLGIKNGLYEYIKEDGSQEYVRFQRDQAGDFQMNQKHGLWREKNTNQSFEFLIYQKGKIIQQQVQEYGKKNRNGNKEGKHLEIFGDENQLKRVGFFKDGVQYGYHEIFFNGIKCGGGHYDKQGKKKNFWIEPALNYNNKLQIITSGFYKNDVKIGSWSGIENDCIMFQGEYDMNGRKSGKWLEFDKEANLLQEGNYLDGLRCDRWDYFELKQSKQIERKSKIEKDDVNFIGGGNYDQLGEKSGEWIEKDKSLYYQRGYYVLGKKIGFHLIYKQIPEFPFDVNLYDELKYFLEKKRLNEISQIGEYQHTILSKNPFFDPIRVEIFGGYYDDNQHKQGYWIEPLFFQKKEIIYEGEYWNNNRIGQWRSLKKTNNQSIDLHLQQNEWGFYNLAGLKQGQWIEFDDTYTILLLGSYLNGKRIGNWRNNTAIFARLGGDYDSEGLKTNKWTELSLSKFGYHFIKIKEGHYLKGKKIGFWAISDINDRELMSNIFKSLKYGKYNQNGQKDGRWIKKRDKTRNDLECEYKEGIKLRNWAYQQIFFSDEASLIVQAQLKEYMSSKISFNQPTTELIIPSGKCGL